MPTPASATTPTTWLSPCVARASAVSSAAVSSSRPTNRVKPRAREIDLVGDDVSNVNLHYSRNENTFASKGQKLIYHGPLKPLEGLLLRSPLVPWSFAASRLYHDGYWYPFVGKGRKRTIMKSEWGRLFREYEPKGQE